MKKLVLSAILLLSGFLAMAQHAFVDAQELLDKDFATLSGDKVRINVNNASQDLLKILQPYISGQTFTDLMRDGVSKEKIATELAEEFKNNEFLVIPGTVQSDTMFDFRSLAGSSGDVLSLASGLNVSTIADGIAKFLVTRTKEELNIAFFSKFRDALKEEKELGILFPETRDILMAIGEEVYNYNAYINALRSAFEVDLRNILVNAEKLVDSGGLKYLEDHPEVGAVVHEGLLIVNALTRGVHPGDILADVATGAKHQANLGILHQNAPAAVKISNHISQSLRSDGDRYWVDAQEVQNAFEQGDREFAYLYLGLLYEAIEKKDPNLAMPFHSGGSQVNVLQWMNNTKADADEVIAFVKDMAAQAAAMQQSIYRLNSSGKDAGFEAYAEVFNDLNALMEHALNINDLPSVNVPLDVQKDLKRITGMGDLVGSIAIAIRKRQYTTAVIKASVLLDSVAGKELVDTTKFIKYATFMAAMVEADSSDQVEKIIESFALPAGSYRIKRYTNSSVAVQGYVGFAGGMEQTLESSLDNQWSFTYSVFSPVGLQISRGSRNLRKGRKDERKGASNGLFLSVIDLGAITAYRFQNNDSLYAEEIPDVKLGQIISPGLFYTHGFARVPLSWGVGAQFLPQLRVIKDPTHAVFSTANAWRVTAYIAVDIPLLMLGSKPAEDKAPGKKK